MNRLYCIYNGEKYIAQEKDGMVKLISKTKTPSFEPYVDVLGNTRTDLWECWLPLVQVEECFREEITIKYHDIWFPVLSVECNEKMPRFVLFTDDELIAKQNDFVKEEQFVFTKTIGAEEISEMKIKKRMINNHPNLNKDKLEQKDNRAFANCPETEIIFNDYGIKVCRQNEKYFIAYDSGEIASKQKMIEVSKEDAERAQKSEKEAYQVLLENDHF